MQNNNKRLAIVILMGGKSTRFGIEKGVIDLLGKPLILHQIETISKFDEDIYLIAHSEEQINTYRKQIKFSKAINFIIDDREIFEESSNIYKPTLGIYSAFKELHEKGFHKAFLLSCDMPLIKPEAIELVIKESEGYDCCIPRWNNGFLEFFFAIYPVKLGLEKAKSILTKKNYGLVNFIDTSWKINYISVENSLKKVDKNLVSLININGPIDLYKVIRLFKDEI